MLNANPVSPVVPPAFGGRVMMNQEPGTLLSQVGDAEPISPLKARSLG